MPSVADVGDPAPEFCLESNQGSVSLRERLEKHSVLLVFYPGDDTPVCTRQLCDYRDNLAAFGQLDVDVLGINSQSVASHQKFAEKHGLPFPLLSDPDSAVIAAYGARGLLGMTKRVLVLIGTDGRIRWRRSDLPFFHRSADELRDVIAGL